MPVVGLLGGRGSLLVGGIKHWRLDLLHHTPSGSQSMLMGYTFRVNKTYK